MPGRCRGGHFPDYEKNIPLPLYIEAAMAKDTHNVSVFDLERSGGGGSLV